MFSSPILASMVSGVLRFWRRMVIYRDEYSFHDCDLARRMLYSLVDVFVFFFRWAIECSRLLSSCGFLFLYIWYNAVVASLLGSIWAHVWCLVVVAQCISYISCRFPHSCPYYIDILDVYLYSEVVSFVALFVLLFWNFLPKPVWLSSYLFVLSSFRCFLQALLIDLRLLGFLSGIGWGMWGEFPLLFIVPLVCIFFLLVY